MTYQILDGILMESEAHYNTKLLKSKKDVACVKREKRIKGVEMMNLWCPQLLHKRSSHKNTPLENQTRCFLPRLITVFNFEIQRRAFTNM